MKPYFERDGIVLFHGDCREILPGLGKVDAVVTDPPYGETTHKGARTLNYGDKGGGSIAIDFDSTDEVVLSEVFSMCCPRRWVVSFIDWEHCLSMKQNPPDGLEFIRIGVWTKLNPMPQLTGDRPGMGWEAIAIFHPPGKKRWNGKGRSAVWSHGTSRYGWFGPSNHPTEKPIGLVSDFVDLFTDTAETILDPFAGSATTLLAAWRLGRKAIGIELSEAYCKIGAARLNREMDQGRLFKPEQPTFTQPSLLT